jgi:hypothetical protein
LSEESILEAFGPARWLWQGWVYTPAVTVWTFLSQCLSMDHSCRDAVARLIAWRVARGLRLFGHGKGGRNFLITDCRTISGYDIPRRIQGHAHAKPTSASSVEAWACHPSLAQF